MSAAPKRTRRPLTAWEREDRARRRAEKARARQAAEQRRVDLAVAKVYAGVRLALRQGAAILRAERDAAKVGSWEWIDCGSRASALSDPDLRESIGDIAGLDARVLALDIEAALPRPIELLVAFCGGPRPGWAP